MSLRFIMLGDVVGTSGVRAVQQQMEPLRRRWRPDLVIANGENAHNGSGLTPRLYQQLMEAGVDAITLGDHVYRRAEIAKVMAARSNIIRPANLSRHAKGPRWMQLTASKASAGHEAVNVYVLTVLGRIFPTLPADDPFEAVESILGQLPDLKPIVILEVHAEATSEKVALAYHFDGQVAAVIGTHTHVPTADARILTHGTAFITDIGMCGPHDSIIGRRADRVLTTMTTAMPTPFDVAEGDPRINGVFIEIDPQTRQAIKIERIELAADVQKPPFVRS